MSKNIYNSEFKLLNEDETATKGVTNSFIVRITLNRYKRAIENADGMQLDFLYFKEGLNRIDEEGLDYNTKIETVNKFYPRYLTKRNAMSKLSNDVGIVAKEVFDNGKLKQPTEAEKVAIAEFSKVSDYFKNLCDMIDAEMIKHFDEDEIDHLKEGKQIKYFEPEF